ncbi:MAG: hypothetical protein H6Q15_978 [Bacteroidetes bacterium]|nr:hypothetical protein [Bacteroidota bacterium]
MKKIYFLLIVSLLFTSVDLSAQNKVLKRKVAIGRFSNETQYAKSVFYDKDNDPMGKQAADILAARLASTDKFLLLERQDMDKITEEMKTNNASLKAIGADFLIIGSITEYGRKTIGTDNVFSTKKEQIVEAGVSIRLVDVSTGLIIFSGEAKGEAIAENKQVMGIGKTADFDATLSDKAISAAISKLVENIINKCMDNQWKAYFLSAEDNTFFISGGKSQGITMGDVFDVFENGKKVKNPQTGIEIELPGKKIARIKVEQTIGTNINDEISIVTFVDGNIDVTKLDKYYITEIKN